MSSTVVVDGYVVPRLQEIQEIKNFSDAPKARLRLEGLLNPDIVAELKSLPLALCHIDVNRRNVSPRFKLAFHCTSHVVIDPRGQR